MNFPPPLSTHHPIIASSHPATIGILGGGQLGRMLALAGIPMGLRFRFLESSGNCPAAELGEVIVGDYTNEAALARFSCDLTVATYEFENVPASTARWLTEHVPVFPPQGVLAIAQERLAEKQLFRHLGIGTPEFIAIDSLEQLAAATAQLGFPCILKTRRLGYDGKGQWLLKTPDDVRAVRLPNTSGTTIAPSTQPGTADLILESFVPFTRELSILAARSHSGECVFYPLTHNTHRGGILRESIAPPPPEPGITPDLQTRAESIATRVLNQTEYVGVLAIELFHLADGTLIANEMAPRVHNSGHWTQDAPGVTSQFENHLRAILGWPLGPTHPTTGVMGMLNILEAIPDASAVLRIPGAHLHLYGKSPRPGELRKVGHINVAAPDHATLAGRLAQARSLLV